MTYRKSQKPPVKLTGWPHEDVKAMDPTSKGGAYAMSARDVDEVIDHYTERNSRYESLRKLGMIAFGILFVFAVVVFFAASEAWEEEAQADCRRRGGQVGEVHNVRRFGFGTPWVCVGDR